MTIRSVPTFLQAGSHPAENTRLALAGFLKSPIGTAFAGGVGGLDPGHGVTTPSDLAVSQSGPGMAVSVAPGSAFIRGTQSALQGVYHVVNDAAVVLPVDAADPTNPRRDLVIVHVRDSFYSGADNDARLLIVKGTPAASPSDPSLAAYPNALVLARLQVNASPDASIVTGDITDFRSYAGAPALEIACTSTTRPKSVAKGTRIYETDTGRRLVYYGATTGWAPPWGDPWGKVGTAEISVAQNVTSLTAIDVTSSGITFTNYPNRDFLAHVSMYLFNSGASISGQFNISNSSGTLIRTLSPSQVLGSVAYAQTVQVDSPAAAGSTTWKLQTLTSGGTMVLAHNTSRGFFTINDMGPVTATVPAD